MMNFSVVLIAKNEAKTLPRLKASLEGFLKRGGEVILVDTGSTDDTVKCARGFGFKVFEEGERFVTTLSDEKAKNINERFVAEGEEAIVKGGDRLFDYSAARNYAASLAKNDMVAMPDCDEEYTRFDLNAVEELIRSGTEQLEYNFVFAHDDAGKPIVQFMHCKFYNRKKLKWVGIVHEILQGEAKRTFVDENVIKLEHWQQQGVDHRGRYLAGLALDCFENPDHDRNSHYLARELFWKDRPKSAIKEFERHIAMDKWAAEKAQSMIFIGKCYGVIGDPQKQTAWYSRAFYWDSGRREALIELALFFLHNKAWQAAIAYAKACLEIPYTPFYANNMTHYTNLPHEILYRAYGWLGNVEAAKAHLTEALRFCPTNPQYLADMKYYFPKISIVIPSLGRQEGLRRCTDSIFNLVYAKDLIEVIVIKDIPRMGVPKRLKEGVARSSGHFIVYASNDIEFTPFSLLEALQVKKGLVSFNTGPLYPDKGNICEHFIIRRDMIDQIGGEIFDTEFNHVGVDNLLWAKCEKLGETARAERAIVRHYHFSQGAPMDNVYELGWSEREKDRGLLRKKLAALYA